MIDPRQPHRLRRWAVPAITCMLVLAACVSMASARPGTARIVNGDQVSAGTFTARWEFFVALVYQSDQRDYYAQFCGGSRIAPDVIVTAAHCVTEPTCTTCTTWDPIYPQSIEILEGAHTLAGQAAAAGTSATDGTRRAVKSLYIRPDFNAYSYQNDVAVIRTTTPADPSLDNIQVASDPEMDTLGASGAGTAVSASDTEGPWIGGFGDLCATNYATHQADCTNNSGDYATAFNEVKVPIASDAQCGSANAPGYGADFDANTMICGSVLDTLAGDGTNGKDTCQGDSGGPLIAGNDAGTIPLRLVGITSWGSGCASEYYGVYTRLDVFRDWVTSISSGGEGPGGLQDPTNVAAGTTTASGIPLTWNPPATGPVPATYHVYRRSTNGALLKLLATVSPDAGDPSNLSTTLSGLLPNTTYTLVVRSVSTSGTIGESSGVELSATTGADSTPPAAPGTPQLASRTRTSIRLRWSAASDNVAVYRYRIYMRKHGVYVQVGSTAASTRTFSKGSLRSGTSYAFRVRAVDQSGNISAPSTAVLRTR